MSTQGTAEDDIEVGAAKALNAEAPTGNIGKGHSEGVDDVGGAGVKAQGFGGVSFAFKQQAQGVAAGTFGINPHPLHFINRRCGLGLYCLAGKAAGFHNQGAAHRIQFRRHHQAGEINTVQIAAKQNPPAVFSNGFYKDLTPYRRKRKIQRILDGIFIGAKGQ